MWFLSSDGEEVSSTYEYTHLSFPRLLHVLYIYISTHSFSTAGSLVTGQSIDKHRLISWSELKPSKPKLVTPTLVGRYRSPISQHRELSCMAGGEWVSEWVNGFGCVDRQMIADDDLQISIHRRSLGWPLLVFLPLWHAGWWPVGCPHEPSSNVH